MFRVPELFENCTSPSSLCEHPENLLGAGAGTCNTTTLMCDCPPDYDGKDLFTSWNDCHISNMTRLVVEYLATGFLGLCALASFISIFRLLIHWGIIYWAADEVEEFQNMSPPETRSSVPRGIVVSTDTIPLSTDPSSPPPPLSPTAPKRRTTLQNLIPSLDLGELQTPKPNARTTTFQQTVTERKRRRNTLSLITIWLLFSVFALIFQGHRHMGVQFDERVPLMLVSLAMTMSTVVWGLWMMTYTWFSNFPSLKTFATMFPSVKGNVLIKHPNFLKVTMLVNCVLTTVAAMILVVIIPLIDEKNMGRQLYQGLASVAGVFIMIFCLIHSGACLVLLKLFRVLRTTSNKEGLQKFGKGERTVIGVLLLTCVAGPFFTIWMFVMAFHPIGIRYSFFFVSSLFVGGSCAGLVSTFVFVFRMGSKTRTRKSSTSHSPNININSKKSFKRVSVEERPLSPLQE